MLNAKEHCISKSLKVVTCSLLQMSQTKFSISTHSKPSVNNRTHSLWLFINSKHFFNQVTRFYSRNFKKITDLKRVQFGNIEGLLISDKTGEIGFINIKNLNKLPVLREPTEEEKKKGDLPFEENGVYKTMFGH